MRVVNNDMSYMKTIKMLEPKRSHLSFLYICIYSTHILEYKPENLNSAYTRPYKLFDLVYAH